MDGSRTVRLGGTDVARIGLGTNRLTNTAKNVRFIRDVVVAGIGLIDTAHLYTGGRSEETLGEALSPVPEGVIVATKGGFAPGEGRPQVLHAQIEDSLRRLRTERIRLYYLHRVDPETPLEESLGAIKEHVDRGQIEQVGLCQVTVEQIERARRIVPIAAVQSEYNVSERGWDDVVEHCAREGILFVPYYPLHGGGDPELTRIAERRAVTPSQVALAWLLRRSPTTLPIPGTLSIDHARENIAALDIELTQDEVASLE